MSFAEPVRDQIYCVASRYRVSNVEHCNLCRFYLPESRSLVTPQSVASRKRAKKRKTEPEQLALFKHRGGKRRRAGRPAKGARPGMSHAKRPVLLERHPVHITLRVVAAVGSLRRRAAYHAIRQATLTAALRGSIRIVHLSIQRTHIHVLVEAKNQYALAAGMQSFQVSAAKHLNAAVGKITRGPRRRGTSRTSPSSRPVTARPRDLRHARPLHNTRSPTHGRGAN